MILFVIVGLLLLAGAIHAFLALYCRRHREVRAAWPLELLMWCSAVWPIDFALELISPTLGLKVVFLQVRNLVLPFLSVLEIWFILTYLKKEEWIRGWRMALLLVIPCTTVLLDITTNFHTLYRYNFHLDPSGPFPVLLFTNGPGFLVYLVFTYTVVIAGLVLLMVVEPDSRQFFRRQRLLILTGFALPLVADILYYLGLTPVPGLMLTPFVMVVSGLIYVYAIFWYGLVESVPIARNRVIERMSSPVIVIDTRDRVNDLNPAAARLLGVDAEKILGKPYSPLLRKVPGLLELVGSPSPEQRELNVGEGPDRQFFSAGVDIITSGSGMVVGTLVVLRDITGLRRAMDTLTRISSLKQQLLKPGDLSAKLQVITEETAAVFRASLVRIWLRRDGDRCRQGCPWKEDGTCPGDVPCFHLVTSIGMSYGSHPGVDRIPRGVTADCLIAEGSRPGGTARDPGSGLLGPDREDVSGPVCMRTFRLGPPEGDPAGVLVITRPSEYPPEEEPFLIDIADLTDRVVMTGLLEEELRESEEKFRTIVEEMQDMFYRTDLSGTLRMITPYGAKLAGYDTPDDLIGKNSRELYASEEEYVRFHEILDEKGSVTGYPLVLTDRYGEKRYVTVSSHQVRDSLGRVIGVEGLVHDMTGLHLAETALKNSNRQLKLLTSITRHDINNQLMALGAYLEIAGKTLSDPQKTAAFLEKGQKIIHVIGRQIALTKEYEVLGMKEPGWQEVSPLVRQAGAALPLRDVLLTVGCEGVGIFADLLLEKVFYNLVDNALRYGGPGLSRITVSCGKSGEDLLLVFLDDGAGVAAGDKPRLFERGFGKNTGLGLFLSREILGVTGITITETGEPGKGARFEIQVPKGLYRCSPPV